MRTNSAVQVMDKGEPEEELVSSPTTVQVTWNGSSFTVSDKRHGVYQHNDTVTWKIDGKNFKQDDTLTISAVLPRLSFSYVGTCLADGKDFEVSGKILIPFPKPVRYSWDPAPATSKQRLVQYQFAVAHALAPARERTVTSEPAAPGNDDPCLVIDTSGGPTMEPQPGSDADFGRHRRQRS